MALDSRELSKLRRIVAIAEKMIAVSPKPKRGRPPLNATRAKNGKAKRIRRTGPELARFRKMLKAERKKGVPVAELAKKHGVSLAYVYLL